MASIDLGALYGAARQRIVALVTDTGVDLETMVPATPAWRVRDVLSHVAGVPEDAITGNMEGAPNDAWTAAQVARGRDRTLPEVLAGWEKFGPMMEGFLSSPAGAPASAAVMDIHSHEADLRNALELPAALPDVFVAWSMEGIRDGFHSAIAAAKLPAIKLNVADAELFRARLGRRTVAEVCAYDWSDDPAPYLDDFFIFGPAQRSIGERL